MKKLLILAVTVLPILAVADQYDRRLIHTNGYGEVKVKPDMAVLSLSASITRTLVQGCQVGIGFAR